MGRVQILLEQILDAALVHELPVAVERVPRVAHHLASLGDVPELFCEVEKPLLLHATLVDANPDNDGFAGVWLFDQEQDYCVSVAHGVDEEDDGQIEVMVGDQLNARSKNVAVVLQRSCLQLCIDEGTRKALPAPVTHFVVGFEVLWHQMRQTLEVIFRGLEGLVVDS